MNNMSERRTRQTRRRKQPRMRKMETAVPLGLPKLQIPKAARQRRRRNTRQANLPLQSFRTVILSTRWISLALFALVVYALYLTGMSEQFYLTTIPVEGTFSISANEVVQSSGLAGAHIFAADPNKAAENLADIPGVIAAKVTLQWPNDVSIQIEEDTPIAVWVEGSNRFWITGNGRLIPARPLALNLIHISSERLPLTEEGDTPNVSFIPEALYHGALQLQDLRPEITSLSYRPSSGLSFEDERGWQVYLGTGTDMNQKLVIYETIVAQLQEQGITPLYVSVSNKEKPYFRAQ